MIARTSSHIVKMVFSHTPAYRYQVSSLIEYSTAELTDTVLGRSSGILLITVCISYATPSPTASLSSSSHITTSTASPGYLNAKLPKTSLLPCSVARRLDWCAFFKTRGALVMLLLVVKIPVVLGADTVLILEKLPLAAQKTSKSPPKTTKFFKPSLESDVTIVQRTWGFFFPFQQ
jgi:hypothetical protein